MKTDEMLACIEAGGLRDHDLGAYLQLRKICDYFHKDYNDAMMEVWDRMDCLSHEIGSDGKITPALRAYIVDMVKTGLDENLALSALDSIYIQNGMHEELLGACHEILEFGGFARDMVTGSVLVESAIHRLVYALSTDREDPKKLDKLAKKCGDLLKRRACALGIDVSMHHGESDPLYRTDLISMDVIARRGFKPTQRIACLLREYSGTSRFLGLTGDKISSLVRDRTDLAYHASTAIHERESVPLHESPRPTTLDELESLLLAMERRGLDACDARYDSWRKDMCRKKLAQCVLEMRLYLHFLPADEDLELEPDIDDNKKADLRVKDLYVEAFAPHEATHTAFGHMLLANSSEGLARKICGKSQIGSFGSRRSIMVLKDPHNYVADTEFQEMLACRIRPHTQLGGVLVARDTGTRYTCTLVKNAAAASRITGETEQMVREALESPYVQ